MDASVHKALEATAQRYFDMSARGDAAALKQNSIPLISANFAVGASKRRSKTISRSSPGRMPVFVRRFC